MNKLKTYQLILISFFLGIEIFLISGLAQSPSFETYTNPVILGDHPDATLTRIGNDFYTAGSSFNVTPVIYHSTDLVHYYSMITCLEFDPKSINDEAGLTIIRGDEKMFVKLASTKNEIGHKVISFSFDAKKYETENIISNTLWLKIIRINHIINGFYSSNGTNWIQIGESFDVSEIDSYSDFSSFTGTRQGLFVKGSNDAFFDLYIYRDAYSLILAECPANQYGTARTTLSQGIYLLDSIHKNDWALYAGAEFGNSEYLKAPKAIEIIASSASKGGIVEVWLDSINTGTKVAECEI